ncbi:hypothetical protein BH18VER2_BH18VER2_00160 [soil metagenome]
MNFHVARNGEIIGEFSEQDFVTRFFAVRSGGTISIGPKE